MQSMFPDEWLPQGQRIFPRLAWRRGVASSLLGAWNSMKTLSAKKADIQRRWYLIDADDKVLGRLASRIATILRGKHKPIYTPHVDTGDHVIVINASKIRLTGNKRQEKFYAWHSGYPGGFKSILAGKLLAQRPQRVVELAVKGMLPKNKLGRAMLKKLKVYAGPDHPHQAQQPKPLEVEPS